MIKIPSMLTQTGPIRYPLVDSNDVKGGLFIVDTIQERDEIYTESRKEGMLCLVRLEEPIFYQLKGGIENNHWTEFKVSQDIKELSTDLIKFKDSNLTETLNELIDKLNKQLTPDDIQCGENTLTDHLNEIIDELNREKTTEDIKYGEEKLTTKIDEIVEEINKNVISDRVMYEDKKLTDVLSEILKKLNTENEILIPLEDIKVDKQFLILKKDESFTLTTFKVPETSDERIFFDSSDDSIATVDIEGKITGIESGSCSIMIRGALGKVLKSCNIIVARDNITEFEVTDGLVCKLDASSNKDNTTWNDHTENNNNAELKGFDDNSDTNGWHKDCLMLDGNQYIKLPSTLMTADITTIELLTDLKFDTNPRIVKLFAKKNTWSDMSYQLNNETICFGSKGIAEIENINSCIGLCVYGFIINKISKVIQIYINGRFHSETFLGENIEFGKSINVPLLIATSGPQDSHSSMDLYAIKIFDKGLNERELLSDAEYLTGFYDGVDDFVEKHFLSGGKWSRTLPCFPIEDQFFIKSPKLISVEPGERYKIILINSNYTGMSNANGFNIEMNKYNDLNYLIKFNNGISEFIVPEGINFLNFSIKKQSNINVYSVLQKI